MAASTAPSWQELEQAVGALQPLDRIEGPTNAQAQLRLFGLPEASVRVTLYRDHHAWCPYCQKVWLWLEEKRIPYRIRKVTMFCYGEKESWFKQLVPSGMLPALQLDGRLITESDVILESLEAAFGPLGAGLNDPEVLPLRMLERRVFRAWCQWLCRPNPNSQEEESGRLRFQRSAVAMEEALAVTAGPFLLGPEPETADLIFVPYLERMAASLAYYKGYLLRQEHPAIDRWFAGLELRPTYLGTQSDFHTHAHDLPPQMGGCHANGSRAQLALASRIDRGPWPIGSGPWPIGSDPGAPDLETSQAPPANSALLALARVLAHRGPILERNPLGAELFDPALRAALSGLLPGCEPLAPPPGTAPGLRYLRNRINVPRDMPLHAARRLRQVLGASADLDGACQGSADPALEGPPIPFQHRRDQNPLPFLAAK
ncbi:glutathione S-transferase family protein [Cyanobium sp. WAJ14-Wanaka]|uniref:glutathione S-transferase family protein n=1 Tax=Cyanobium sp. WAJ14-Wanaka TaxID=2823725 RepID=UPI0020CC859B|nr:glutathione S-transferase family protein [Cyanobium sp. WAJ14-Wanaka]MCP9774896.1 glutathione S-transferase family protein [Cyanobium sp. WAJ14-Wanaka]